jgi:hypothetical protein
MTLPRNILLRALKQPRHATDYIFRTRKLSKFLLEDAYEIRDFFKEAGNVREGIETRWKIHEGSDWTARLLAPSVIYAIVRALKPDTFVETGVQNGVSTYFILSALERNGYGMLHSIDIRETLQDGKKVGWLVPDELKHRWDFSVGDSKEVVPKMLSELEMVDIFMHDSLHTYDHMSFEFRTAWKYIREGGVLITDDIDQNRAFEDFIRVASPSCIATFALLGALRK